MSTQPGKTQTPGPTPSGAVEPGEKLVDLRDISKSYGPFAALRDVSFSVVAGQVTCVLGDNGAGKSTLIKVLSGLHKATSGQMLLDGEPVVFSSPRDALSAGIATVYQDLAVVGQMSVWRNFFLGQEATGRFGWLKSGEMRQATARSLAEMGIDIPDVDVPVDSLSGGQRQVLAIARAVHFGARLLILDEPTAALGVKQSGMVLRLIKRARDRGLGVVFITHNPQHAWLVGDRFVLLNLGRQTLNAAAGEVSLEELTHEMSGGGELAGLADELARER
ncbi:ATP-binding cassette domain-containing protein [Corynebacterium atypicum]|uniref:ATP-binding cassette domain-containing protein n=1 Tax=Corynebacterium atypicum TaxID=191610 RepID=UPI0009FE132B|nr:ATP-binding cassette domain-containing protein [Corynebacterium atypicum]